MDPLSAAASVIAVVQVADRIIALCKAYITGVIDAPTDLRAILIEVGSVKCVLEVIELLDSSRGESAVHSVGILGRLQQPLEGCKEALKSLEALFPPQSENPVRGKRKRLALSLTTLAWPFKRDKALKLLEVLGRHKSTISLGLTVEAAQDLKDIRENVEKIHEATTDAEMDRILNELVTTDPSPNHDSACELHEDHTGQWLINSPEYADWKTGDSRFLWLHGIPGAGKTVLHSFIAEDVRKLCEQSEGSACAFYYCYFGRNQDETKHFLRWIIHELCRSIGSIPQVVRTNFKQTPRTPTWTLISMLEDVAVYFSRIYITIDALDESANREHIVAFLPTIFANPQLRHIHLLATSRKELDIERVISPVSVGLSLSNPYVDEDIRTYVRGRLQEDSKFARWPESLKTETEAALVKGAKGMFRWAFCQLDALKRLHTIPAIRSALTQLPKSLDETYERILCNIPPESQNMVYKTLSFVAGGYEIDLLELAAILAVDVENHAFDRTNQPFDLYAPVEAAACLLTYDSDSGKLYLAHYTVKEYLVSSRIGQGPARNFQLTDDSMHALFARCFIFYMLYEDYSLAQNPLMVDAIKFWPHEIRSIAAKSIRESISTLIIQLLDPTEPHYEAWTETILKPYSRNTCPLWSVEPGAEDCAILASLCFLGLVEAAQYLLDMWKAPFPFHVPLYWGGHIQFTRLEFATEHSVDDVRDAFLGFLNDESAGHEILTVLQLALIYEQTSTPDSAKILDLILSRGADINLQSATGFYPINTLLNYRTRYLKSTNRYRQVFLEYLLAKGAEVNPAECTIKPLQSAMEKALFRLSNTVYDTQDIYQAIQTLLKNGARPNSVASDHVNIWRIRHTCELFYRKYEECRSVWMKESEYINFALENRGTSRFYDTPLRMLDNAENELSAADAMSSVASYFQALRDLLISYGGKSLHLFPIEDLPGYNEEDMEEWNKLEELQVATLAQSRKQLDVYTRSELPQASFTN